MPILSSEHYSIIRTEIDAIDKKLVDIVGQRTEIVREIGRYKKENAVTILQIERWFEILKSRKIGGMTPI